MSKHGFTLVEMMVVIIIIGILGAIGVPKLFSQTAKARAAELAPAAASYIKLQEAYAFERKRVGSWKRIGYSAPKSSSFHYKRGSLTQKPDSEGTATLGVGWSAKNQVPLVGCSSGNEWTITVLSNGKDSKENLLLEYKTEIVRSETAIQCASFTPDWEIASGN